MRWASASLAVLGLAATAVADEVILKNGQTLEGVVIEREEKVIIELENGTVTLDKSQVKEIVGKSTAAQEFEERRKSAATADEHYELGQWAAARGLKQRAGDQYRRAVALEPGHAPARKQLGFFEHEGRWLTEEQYMALKGFTEYEGRWVPWDLFEKLRNAEIQSQNQPPSVYVLDSMLENRGNAGLPRVDLEDRFDRVVAPRRTAPWNWGVRGWR